ncbi:hypothetical protein [Polymorphospora sp. NPDC050346]|uniref:hypothetical protein n=1 Tax=Polymorphospora sp. NPDC050346 TaxID=3155780 RepID=UPI0033D66040
MTGVSERLVESPCGWCGRAITQPDRGRKRTYCDRSCRQRAYEVRTARRRLDVDVDAGRVRLQPAERVVERVVQARVPTSTARWESLLTELAAQLHDGRIPAWDRDRIRAALAGVTAELEPAPPVPSPVRPVVDPAAEAVMAAAGDGSVSTTLTRLAADVGLPVDAVRAALADLAAAGRARLTRHGAEVDVDVLVDHARFAVDLA